MVNKSVGVARGVLVLGTGGTIAGRAASASDNVGYTAGEVGVDALLEALDLPSGLRVWAEQVAQLDSKDMGFEVWQAALVMLGWSAVTLGGGALLLTRRDA